MSNVMLSGSMGRSPIEYAAAILFALPVRKGHYEIRFVRDAIRFPLYGK